MIGDNTQNNLFSFYCGLVIKKLRKERGISGFKLAKQLNISQQQMSRYERGVNRLSIDTLFSILTILDVSFEKLLRLLMTEIRSSNSNDALVLKEKISLLDSIYFY
ncbi:MULTISPECIES: helix-turn-helix domain-containing protein [unclassified Providencia]|uniref:helix-turn-helix domain-containing protein n=1 Tax=unclassified Providencia TaxID=2633465 RepID=UPI000E9494E0|nr:helix-turn-helix transcriptional regulator [Providencia sp.]MBP6081666.1 helix-turn-helix transcriptional regulator [Providencia sp.]HBO22101.1 XRE family transcriptional regulator [Providencia sp.]